MKIRRFTAAAARTVLGRTEPLKCWKTTGHGSQNLTQAIQHSCNVALVQIGQLVGARTFYKYAEAFGFLNLTSNVDSNLTAKTGIDMSGESGSIWWSQNTFYDPENLSQLAAASFGQTFTITPLQLITAVSACVNGGYLMKPYVVKSIVNSDGEAVVSNSPTVVRQVVSEQTSATVRQILEQVVGDPVDGTGKNAYVAGYRIGGKTGTSEKVAQDAAGGAKEYIVSFIGFAPADDPQIVILVLLDTPSNSTGIYISGGQMAAPVVGKMMADILPYLGVEPSYSETEKTHMDKTVPNVTGLSVEQAKAALAEVGLQARIYGDGGTITAQLPGSGAVVANGSTILLYAGKEPSADKETMPDLSNLSYQTARDRMAALGLYIKTSSSITDTAAQVDLRPERRRRDPDRSWHGRGGHARDQRFGHAGPILTNNGGTFMKLKRLLSVLDVCECTADPELDIRDISFDSRTTQPGDLFAAVCGYESDGHRFIGAAAERGAAVVLCQRSSRRSRYRISSWPTAVLRSRASAANFSITRRAS